MIAMGWLMEDARPAGRLPKYNPARRKTFSLSDWQHVCGLTSEEFRKRGLNQIFHWIDAIREKPSPRKLDQMALTHASACSWPCTWLREKTALWSGMWRRGT